LKGRRNYQKRREGERRGVPKGEGIRQEVSMHRGKGKKIIGEGKESGFLEKRGETIGEKERNGLKKKLSRRKKN